MRKISVVYLIFAIIITFGACNDPIFHYISVEPPIVHPFIEGSPTNFVEFDNKIYVASGSNIFSYDGTKWGKMTSQPGGRIEQLAVTNTYLYALCYQGSNSILKRYSSSSEKWEDVEGTTGGYDIFQSVYAMDDKVFIGAGIELNKKIQYTILHIADDSSDTNYEVLTAGGASALLCGVASISGDYFLCTKSDTIYKANGGSISIAEDPKVEFTGIINLEVSHIVAISRNGRLYKVETSGITNIPNVSIGSGHYSTGALAIWTDGTNNLLLAGRQDRLNYSTNSGYTYGYMELELDLSTTTGIKDDRDFEEPGKPIKNPPGKNTISSVDDYDRYVTTLRKNPVNHIFQTPAAIDANMTLFASTQKNGVWSYRPRGDDNIPQWNAEDNKY